MTDTRKNPAGTAAPARSRKKLFIGAGVLTLLLGGGGFAAYSMLAKPAAAAPAAPVAKEHETGILTFEPFVVNLADPGGQRFLRISLRLIVGEDDAEHIKKDEVALMRLRSAFVEVLTEQTAGTVVTPEGKTALKKRLLERATGILQPVEVSDVLFSDFVVQF